MIQVPNPEDLSDFNLSDYSVQPLEKYVDRRGYMYILFDYKFPEHIKVGRSGDCKKRLYSYNSDKPYPTSKYLYISEMFDNVIEVERRILAYMYDNTAPTTLSKEWFQIEHKEKIIQIIEKAENLKNNQ
jgi:hypothetical protein